MNKNQVNNSRLKISPLIRSIITNYRMIKLNRIEEMGFIFLMLNKDNVLQFELFSYFISCLKLDLEKKVKIVKGFLANCDLKTKDKKISISESGFGRFLIRCPEFNFELLNSVAIKQKINIDKAKPE